MSELKVSFWIGVFWIVFTHFSAPYACYEIVNLDIWTAFYFALVGSSKDVAHTGGAVSKA
jgi:hypothetical protein